MSAVMTTGALPTLGRRSERILQTLRTRIDEGVYGPNSRLPTENDLCVMFDASRTTVRRAIARLAGDGYVEVVQGSGTYVLQRPSVADHPSCTLSVMFPFDGRSLAHVQGLALNQDYLLSIFTHTDWSPEMERSFLKRVLQEHHRGLLAFCTPLGSGNDDLLDELEAAGTRVVHVEHYRLELPVHSYVLPDYRRGGSAAANALMIAGYRHFRFVGLVNDGPYAEIACAGFEEALLEQGEPVDPTTMRVRLPRNFQGSEEGRRILETFIASLPPNTGIVARSVDLAEELQLALQQHQRRVPEEIGIVGVKQLLNYRADGSVDHVEYDWQHLLRLAVQAVVAPEWQGIQQLIPPRLIRQGTLRQPPAPSF